MTQTMYAGIANSPSTTLDGAIDASVTTISVVDASKLPSGPNLAVIGTDETAETILYTAISTNDLTGVTRGFQGIAKSWSSGESISRNFTAYDYEALRLNVADLIAIKHNYTAIVSPTATDDTSDGYSIGSIWIDTVLDEVYICADATASAAIWTLNGGWTGITRSTTTLATDSNTVAIDIAGFNSTNDSLLVFANTVLIDGSTYTADSTNITKTTGTWDSGTVFSFLAYKNLPVISSTPWDGSNIEADTVTNAKLATDIKVGSLAALTTTDKDSVVDAINELQAGSHYASMSRQAIIDGNFQVAQVGEGAAVTNPTNLTYPVFDLWKTSFNVDGGTPPTIIHSQSALTPGELDGASYAYKIAVNGAGSGYGSGSYYSLRYYVEHGVRALCGLNKKVTVSFWAKSTIANKRIGFHLYQIYGTGGSPSAVEVLTGDNFTLTSSWQKYSITFTTNTLVGKTFGTANDVVLLLDITLQWGSGALATRNNTSTAESWVGSGDIYIAQVQLCSGDVALPFEPKSYQQELEACRRFLRPLNNTFFRIYAYSPDCLYFSPVTHGQGMRIPPNLIKGVESTGWNIYPITGNLVTGFIVVMSGYNITATKTSHGMTDAIIGFNASGNFLDSRF